jgi:two-component system, cell cycle response regulator DivK
MSQPPHGPLVLVVEDDPVARDAYKAILGSFGFAVNEAGDGATGVEMALQAVPALVIMDLELPRMDGWTATRVLKSDPRTRDVPIVVASGYAAGEAKDRAVEAGCDGYLRKPWDPHGLLTEVRRLIAEATSARDHAAPGMSDTRDIGDQKRAREAT